MSKINKTLLIVSSLFLIGCSFDGTGLGTSSMGDTEGAITGNDSTVSSSTSTSLTSSETSKTSETFDIEISSGESSTTLIDESSSSSGETLFVCGNGILEANEECDDKIETALCNANCTLAKCGDKLLNQSANEECDDGNEEDLDGCDNECQKNRKVFLSSNVYVGDNLIGIAGANAACQKMAEIAKLDGNYKAWLSEGINPKNQVQNRFDLTFNGWYVLIDGIPLAKGWQSLTQNGPLNKILVTELNNKIDQTQSIDVWTNTSNKGQFLPGTPDCNIWGTIANNDLYGRIGDANSIEFWSENTNKMYAKCAEGARLYCFEDPTPGL